MSSSSRKKELPAWFYRVSALAVFPDDEVCPHYFDEDISDLESDKEGSDDEVAVTAECDCGGEDRDCEHQAEGEDDMSDSDDNISERSYDGSEADWYYELKDLREDRKRELKHMAKEKQDAKEYESRKAEEVHTAYKALKKAEKEGETLYMGSLAGKTFRLYSTDHVDYLWLDLWPSKYVAFYHPDIYSEIPHQKVSKNGRRAVEGHIYLDANTDCGFPPFQSPTRPSRRKHVLKSYDGKHELVFQFISDEHLIIKVSRDLVFEGHRGPVPESAPEIFEFMGIFRNIEKEREERLEWERHNRGPSPGETWFEMSHPRGWWNESR